ncbi:hypothetical protein AHAS_Ahas07G0083200 [Arachis hypogaea]
MDVDSELLSSQDNIEVCMMIAVEENVNCTCDCGDSSSKCVGLGVCKGDTTHGKDGTQRRRQFFCNKEGKRAEKYISKSNRKRKHKVLTRNGYKAMLAVGTNGRPSQGYANVGFTKKDLDNHIETNHRAKLIGGDSNATISYLLTKADVDPMGIARYSATDESQLANLFWADGICRADYKCFEDVLAFHTTYQNNKYRRLLVIFSDCNHHCQTCIFGFALIEDEKTATYTWLLQNSLEVMLNKSPSVVVIDGDEDMKTAIQEIFPNATRRLSDWHIQKNTVYEEPVITTHLVALELCAANFYTREIFGKVKIEIEEVVALDAIDEENISITVVLKVKESDRRQHIYTSKDANTKGEPKGKKERGKRRCNKCNNAGHVKKNCPVRNDDNNSGDKIGGGMQASFSTEELYLIASLTLCLLFSYELSKYPMASQGTSAEPNTKVDAYV